MIRFAERMTDTSKKEEEKRAEQERKAKEAAQRKKAEEERKRNSPFEIKTPTSETYRKANKWNSNGGYSRYEPVPIGTQWELALSPVEVVSCHQLFGTTIIRRNANIIEEKMYTPLKIREIINVAGYRNFLYPKTWIISPFFDISFSVPDDIDYFAYLSSLGCTFFPGTGKFVNNICILS